MYNLLVPSLCSQLFVFIWTFFQYLAILWSFCWNHFTSKIYWRIFVQVCRDLYHLITIKGHLYRPRLRSPGETVVGRTCPQSKMIFSGPQAGLYKCVKIRSNLTILAWKCQKLQFFHICPTKIFFSPSPPPPPPRKKSWCLCPPMKKKVWGTIIPFHNGKFVHLAAFSEQ